MPFCVLLQHQTTGKTVKRWTVGLSHFPGCAEGPLCETEGIPERTITMYKNTDFGCEGATRMSLTVSTSRLRAGLTARCTRTSSRCL